MFLTSGRFRAGALVGGDRFLVVLEDERKRQSVAVFDLASGAESKRVLYSFKGSGYVNMVMDVEERAIVVSGGSRLTTILLFDWWIYRSPWTLFIVNSAL